MRTYIGLFCLLLTMHSLHAQSPLDKHKWENRLLIVFAPDGQHTDFQAQLAAFQEAQQGLSDRKLLVYEVYSETGITSQGDYLSQAEVRALYKGFAVALGEFRVLLIGLDGGIKMQSRTVLSTQEIFSKIDKMPMRQTELETRQVHDP